jgi:hypothetical protein
MKGFIPMMQTWKTTSKKDTQAEQLEREKSQKKN